MTTSQPHNQSELQLFRVLQRANLLQYYDTFIAQGGDDVGQLCEAGEEEFLEIMALVGMASKPLHVRRLQKALQEWIANPALFQQTITSGIPPLASSPPGSIMASVMPVTTATSAYSPTPATTMVTSSAWSSLPSVIMESSATMETDTPIKTEPGNGVHVIAPTPSPPPPDSLRGSPSPCSSNGTERNTNSPLLPAVLTPVQIDHLGAMAKRIATTLPTLEAKLFNLKKQMRQEIQDVMLLPFDEPGRLDLMRKYGAIYGRFDAKRKNDKPMTMHEISVNEAAAHLCYHIPALLTRREELFPLARQVVRMSGYQYAKGHSRAQSHSEVPVKKVKMELGAGDVIMSHAVMERTQREQRLMELRNELMQVLARQEEVKARLEEVKVTMEDPKMAEGAYEEVASLQQQIEMLTARQLDILTEQSQIKRRKKRHKNMPANLQDEYETDSSAVQSGSSSPQNGLDTLLHSDPKHLQDTLYEEGLRIAKQYGMADFALEIQELKEVTSDTINEDADEEDIDEADTRENGQRKEEGEENVDGEDNGDELNEQEEWNREVEKDVESHTDVNGKSPNSSSSHQQEEEQDDPS